MKTTINRLPKNTVELTIELTTEEIRPYLEKAAARLSRERPVAGFRPGKAPYAVMEKLLGSDVLYHDAAEFIVRDTYAQAVAEHHLETLGAPSIKLQKLAPGNPFVYKATASLLPQVTLGDYRGLTVVKKSLTVRDDEVDKVLNELRRSRAKESLVDHPARMNDKVEIDFTGTKDGVPIEGATSKNHPIELGSKHFIPGFEDNLVGLKAGETKTFTLQFPKDYVPKHLADQEVTFAVTMRAVYQRDLPEANDAWAKELGGYASLAALRDQLRKNLEEEKKRRERERYELALLEKIREISTIGDLPDMLLGGESEKMVHELRHSVEESGMTFEQYLESIKKGVDELKKEFRPRAERRLATALIARAIAEKEHLEVNDEEVKKELEETRTLYSGNKEVERNLASPEYFRYLKNTLTTKRVTEFLDELMGVEEA